ncbi:HD-GYP domain-containing protein [Alteribacter aurantiacus]|uniref:HD-GYP domain-containing protein n=1 Tax=Alteribacter aurantiacus TaxID=254410 RepID=UPI0004107729|nr:HD-GYP domain-containing protein [Alteribacter aurantiacus]
MVESVKIIPNKDVLIGRSLGEDIVSENGHFLLKKGMTLSQWHLDILLSHEVDEIKVVKKSTVLAGDLIGTWSKEKEEMLHLYRGSVLEIKQLFEAAIMRENVDIQDVMKPFTYLLEKVLTRTSIFLELYQIKGYDEYTYRHSINVGLLAATIGKMLGRPEKDVLELGKAGFFHDIGKMKVPKCILNKKGQLTDNDYMEIKRHPLYGREILDKVEGLSEIIVQGTLLHHERLDGSGYPFGVKGNDIPFYVQVLAVADVYDAISSDRVYRSRYSPFEALEELIKDVYRNKLSGEIVLPFVQQVINGYINCPVRLENGEEGVLVHLPLEEITRPLIAVGDTYVDLRKERHLTIKEVILDHVHPAKV